MADLPVPGLDPEALRFLMGIQGHVTSQLERISAENEIRARLIQEELDRRFGSIAALLDERRDNGQHGDRLLRAEFDQRLTDLKALLDERYATQTKATDKAFDAQQIAMRTAFDAADKAGTAALSAAKEATMKAEMSANARFESVNEFRGQLGDQARTFLPRLEYDTSIKALTEKVDGGLGRMTDRIAALELRLSSRLDLSEGGLSGITDQRAEYRADRAGSNQVVIMVIMVVSVLVAIGSVLVAVLKK